MGIPDFLSHLHGTGHGRWYYGCHCWPCYAAYQREMGYEVLPQAEYEALRDAPPMTDQEFREAIRPFTLADWQERLAEMNKTAN